MTPRMLDLFPDLEREERVDLIDRISEESRWRTNFAVMLGDAFIFNIFTGFLTIYSRSITVEE